MKDAWMIEGESLLKEAHLKAEREKKRIRRKFWISILTGCVLLFLAIICLEIVT